MKHPIQNTSAVRSANNSTSRSSFLHRPLLNLLFTATALLLVLPLSGTAFAASAKWDFDPGSDDWNDPANWMPETVPNGAGDTATFGISNTTAVSISTNTEVDGITFDPGASAYTITASPGLTLTLSGAGTTNNSGVTQNFLTAVDGTGNFGQISFTNSATAEASTIFTNNGSAVSSVIGGVTAFYDTSTAANGTFVNKGGTAASSIGGRTEFYDSSTAGNANFTNRHGTGVGTSATIFHNTSTAANGFFTNEGGDTGALPFALGGQTIFHDSSFAGNGTFVNNGATASGGFGGATVFDYSSTAGNGTFTNNGGAASGLAALGGGNTIFLKTSTAANGIFTNNGAPAIGGEGGVTEFGLSSARNNSPSGGSGTFINNGATANGAVGGKTVFYEASTAGVATLIANAGINGGLGGAIFFQGKSAGGKSKIEVFGNGNLDISARSTPTVTVGSIEGNGDIFLGARNLRVGSNNASTAFSGVMQDGGIGTGGGGSLTKTGAGTLTLGSASIYTGGTTVIQGTLVAANNTGSATGTGTVNLNVGTLGGSGIISGAVTIGTGSDTGANLAPAIGTNKQLTLTLQSSLTLQADATYTYSFKARNSEARTDLVIANGVTINGATIALKGKTQGTLTPGTVLTVVSNTSANPINGTFSNLADGAIVTVNGNNLQASYEGGDGNDLTLTVVP